MDKQPMLFAELSALRIPFTTVLAATAIAVVALLGVSLLRVLATRRHQKPGRQRFWLSRWLYLAFLLLIAVLAVSAFGSIVQFGHMSGYALFAHIAASGGFVFLLAAIALLLLPVNSGSGEHALTDDRWWLARWSAWALVLSGLAAASTMLFSMLPIFDTQGLLTMAAIHRYAGLAVVVAAVFHVYALGCTKLGWR
jgi:hypothetical protein